MRQLAELEQGDLPEVPKFRRIVGPSFIFLGLGLGSGELILWPYLVSNWGLGIIWGAVLGITLQFLLNMEIERYALVNGESVFVGWARKLKWLPVWFLVSSFVPWIWPGIVAAAATALGAVWGWEQTHYLAMTLLVVMGLILTLGPVLYQVQESLQKWLILIGAPFILILAMVTAAPTDWGALVQGMVGKGAGYWWLPAGIPLASFLAALAYSGAGGNLNLAQSYYVREKGYGMGKYLGRITSMVTGKQEQLRLTGISFQPEGENLRRFKAWWRLINWEHGLIFWLAGTATILLVALLAYATAYGWEGSRQGIGFVIYEAGMIGQRWGVMVGTAFLLTIGLMLFATHLSVLAATSRILSENVLLLLPNWPASRMRGLFYGWLWLQIGVQMVVLGWGIKEPLALLTIGAVLNAVAMSVHAGLTLWLNTTALPEAIRPSWWRRIAMAMVVLTLGAFGSYTVVSYLQ